MLKINRKKFYVTVIGAVLFMLVVTGCSQLKNNEPSISKSQESVKPNPPKPEKEIDSTEEINNDEDADKVSLSDDTINNDIETNDDQGDEVDKENQDSKDTESISQEPVNEDIDWEALEARYDPPKIDGLIQAIKDSEIDEDGRVVITPDIKREFNKMGEDYQFFFMPNVSWYNFESTFYEGTGEALAYILFTYTESFGNFPGAPKYEAEARLRKIFAAPNNEYPPLEHKDYRKCIMFDGEVYTPWPESYNACEKIYDLVELKVRQEGEYTYYTTVSNEYQFELSGVFVSTENEIFLNEQAEVLGLDMAAALAKLLENGEISSAPVSRPYTIEFRVEGDDVIPKFVTVDKEI